MRAACLATVAALILVPAASGQEPVALEFSAPAQIVGDVEAVNLTWVLFYFRDGNDAQAEATLDHAAWTNHTIGRVETYTTLHNGSSVDFGNQPQQESRDGFPSLDLRLGTGRGWSSLLIYAKHINVSLEDVEGELVTADGAKMDPVEPQRAPSPSYLKEPVAAKFPHSSSDGASQSYPHSKMPQPSSSQFRKEQSPE